MIKIKRIFSKNITIAFFSVFSVFSVLFVILSFSVECFAITPDSSIKAQCRFDAGLYHCLAIKSDGTVAAWGADDFGQTTVPAGLSDVVAVSAGYYHSLALKADGTVAAWGWNAYGQANVPVGLNNVIAISAGVDFSLALKSDGTIIGWGSNAHGQISIPAGLSGVTAISAGAYFTLALKSDGTVAAWGYNSYGQIDVPAGVSGVTAISAGDSFSLVLKSDGTLVAWGYNGSGQINIPAGLTNAVGISADIFHSLALKSDGTVIAWGANFTGQLNVPNDLTAVVGVSAGGGFSLALKSNGTIVAWGENNYGQSTPPQGLNLAWGRLSDLSVSIGKMNPSFQPGTQNYTVIVDYYTTDVDVVAAIDKTYPASITIQGVKVKSGSPQTIPLNQGANIVEITVTTSDNLVYSYSLVVLRRADAYLGLLLFFPGSLVPAFDPQTTLYSVAENNNVESVIIQIKAQDLAATVTVNGEPVIGNTAIVSIKPGINYVLIQVTAVDSLTKGYIVEVNRAESPSYVAVTGSSPINGAKRVNAKLPIIINFDKPIAAGVNYSLISVLQNNRSIGYVSNINGSSLIISPQTGQLNYYCSYTVSIPAAAVKGTDNSIFATPYKFSFTTGNWWDTVLPKYLASNVSFSDKKVTLVFNKAVYNNTASETELKAAISFASDKTNFSPLCDGDTVKICGRTIIITFAKPISGKYNVIKINGDTLKDAASNVIAKDTVTEYLRAW